MRAIRPLLAACDVATLLIILLAVRLTGGGSIAGDGRTWLGLGIAATVWLAVFQAFGLYGATRVSPRYEARAVIGATACGTILIALSVPWLPSVPLRTAIGTMLALALVLELAGRWAVRSFAAGSAAKRGLALRTLVVGTDGRARTLAQRLASTPTFVPVGFIPATLPSFSPDDALVAEGGEDLRETIQRLAIDCIFVAAGAVSADDVVSISRACRQADIELRISVDTSGIRTSRLSVEAVDGIASVAIRPIRFTRTQAAFKRSLDLAVGSIALLLALPLFAVVGLAIKLTSPGPVFFRQDRVTNGERVFAMYKFRTMVIDHDRALEGTVIDLSQPFFKMENDPRLTRVGRLLRSFSMDELPQLWNVLRGEMSLVGPRPLPLEQVEANREFLSPRHEVRAGMTGLWQISGRSDLDSAEALQIDRLYIDNWSLSFDVYILCKTVGAVLAQRGAL